MSKPGAPLSHGKKLLYGSGAFGYGSIGQTLNSFLMFFGSSVLGIPGFLMGLAIGISTIWDATTDPFVGHFSDNTKSKVFGKRHGYILFASFAVAITNLLIWSISPEWSTGAKFFAMLTLLLVIETFNTCYSTPYQALGLDISKNYQDRTAVQAYKTVFSFLALLVPSVLMTIFLAPTRYETLVDSSRGYFEIAIFTSILCVVCALICFFGTYKNRTIYKGYEVSYPLSPALTQSSARKHAGDSRSLGDKENPSKKKSKGIVKSFFGIAKQKNVGRLILGYAVSLAAGAFITSLGLHVFTYTFQFTTLEIPLVMVSLIIGIIAAQPLWLWHSRKYDKAASLITALGLIIVGMVLFSMVLAFRYSVPGSALLPLVAIVIFICGMGTGCLYSLPISMFADCIHKEAAETGEDKTASSAGFLTFCTKISNAFIMFIVGISLDLIGFRGGEATQTVAVQNWLGWVLISGVVLAAVAAIFIYSGYTYSKSDFSSEGDKVGN